AGLLPEEGMPLAGPPPTGVEPLNAGERRQRIADAQAAAQRAIAQAQFGAAAGMFTSTGGTGEQTIRTLEMQLDLIRQTTAEQLKQNAVEQEFAATEQDRQKARTEAVGIIYRGLTQQLAVVGQLTQAYNGLFDVERQGYGDLMREAEVAKRDE